MATFSLALESSSVEYDTKTLISEFEEGSEERRNPRSKRYGTWNVRSPNLTTAKENVWLAFYDTVNGSLDEFNFTDPKSGTIHTVRFDGPIRFERARSVSRATATFVEVNVNES